MDDIDYYELIKAADVEAGMTIDVVVDLFDVTKHCMALGVNFNPDLFISALEDIVGPEGNILIRAFTWDWCHGKGYSSKRSVSRVGALGTVAMKRSEFKRTRHPIYNWMVWGKDREELCSIDNRDAFDGDSIFAWAESNENYYQVNWGNPQLDGLTVFHYIEEKVGISYRYIKDYTGEYENDLGQTLTKTYSMYVRDLNYQNISDTRVYNPLLLQLGIMKTYGYRGIDISRYKISELCKVYEEDFRSNPLPSAVTLIPV